jgi:tetratricopeptide (TPR) repeat protein
MGLFRFLSKDKIENENKSKPFHRNVNNSERKDWFSRTRPWHKVDSGIIDSLIRIYGDDPMFEVFVITSMENNLVKEYEVLGRKDIEPNVACSAISGILFKQGAKSSASVGDIFHSGKINERQLSKDYDNAMNLLESSVIIDPNQINAYVQLAGLRGMLNKKDDALKYIQHGLEAIRRLKDKNMPFHKSSIPGIQNAAQHLDDTEKMLLAMQSELS